MKFREIVDESVVEWIGACRRYDLRILRQNWCVEHDRPWKRAEGCEHMVEQQTMARYAAIRTLSALKHDVDLAEKVTSDLVAVIVRQASELEARERQVRALVNGRVRDERSPALAAYIRWLEGEDV